MHAARGLAVIASGRAQEPRFGIESKQLQFYSSLKIPGHSNYPTIGLISANPYREQIGHLSFNSRAIIYYDIIQSGWRGHD
jgi:hypothetical protein